MSKALENRNFEELLEINKRQEAQLRSYKFLTSDLELQKSDLEFQNTDLESQNTDLKSQKSVMESRLADMQFQLDQMKRMIFGAKRERFVKNTDEIFDDLSVFLTNHPYFLRIILRNVGITDEFHR